MPPQIDYLDELGHWLLKMWKEDEESEKDRKNESFLYGKIRKMVG